MEALALGSAAGENSAGMTKSNPDYYKELGLNKGASSEELRAAFKRLARENHPDHNPDNPEAEERFKRINDAWQVLSDAEKKARYDRYGHEGLREGFDPDAYARYGGASGRTGGFSGFEGFGGFGGFGGFQEGGGDPFAGFGGFGGGRRARPAADISFVVNLSFKESLEGTERTLKVPRRRPCAACEGKGVLASTTCGVCAGEGSLTSETEVDVRIPMGAQSGDTIRLRGRGNQTQGGRSGDVVLKLAVSEDPRFRREDLNLIGTVSVTPLDLMLGTTLEVEGPWGPLRMKLPAGANPKRVLRAAGRGVKRGERKGDFLVELEIVAERLQEEDRSLLEELRERLRSREG